MLWLRIQLRARSSAAVHSGDTFVGSLIYPGVGSFYLVLRYITRGQVVAYLPCKQVGVNALVSFPKVDGASRCAW